MKNIIYIFLLLSISNWGQETPGKSQQKSILLLNGIAHIGDGTVINKSAIGIKDGKIILVKDALTNTIDKTKYDKNGNGSSKSTQGQSSCSMASPFR